MVEGMVDGTVEVHWRIVRSMVEGIKEGRQSAVEQVAKSPGGYMVPPQAMAMAGHIAKATRTQTPGPLDPCTYTPALMANASLAALFASRSSNFVFQRQPPPRFLFEANL